MKKLLGMRRTKHTIVYAVVLAGLVLAGGRAWASSHSDAPLIKQDPQANLTDVYAFVGTKYNDPSRKVLNVLVSVRPFSEPGDGVIYDRFANDALYSIHITNPSTGETLSRYDFRFSDVNPTTPPGLKNPNTILSYGFGMEVGGITTVGDARQNYTQTYTLRKNGDVLGTGLLTPPPNVGKRTTPAYNDPTTGQAVSGAAAFDQLDAYTKQTISGLPTGEVSFAGPREDGFYADTPAIFDLLDSRIIDNDGDATDGLGQDGGGVDGFKGFNVLSYGLQIPVQHLESVPGYPRVGVYASVSRPKITLRQSRDEPAHIGPWIQVNRLGNPLFNEVFVALKDKDKYNRTSPKDDPAHFQDYALNPEVAKLINLVFGTTLAETGRTDLAAIFIPDVVRIDTSTAPVPLPGQTGFSRLSFIGGDFTDGLPSGWPNGRRIGDDVVDIALTALASGTVLIGDNMAANDQVYNQVFPYLATPHSGTNNSKDSLP